MPETIGVDPEALRADVRETYREVALHPDGESHFHTGRPLAALPVDFGSGDGFDCVVAAQAVGDDVAAHVFLAHRPAS